jgi:hypothetical protein
MLIWMGLLALALIAFLLGTRVGARRERQRSFAYGMLGQFAFEAAQGAIWDLQVQDGQYSFVDHSWCWTRPVSVDYEPIARTGFPNILDPYAVGRLPQVTLVHCHSPSLPHVGWSYRPTRERTDIRQDAVDRLVQKMRSFREISST